MDQKIRISWDVAQKIILGHIPCRDFITVSILSAADQRLLLHRQTTYVCCP